MNELPKEDVVAAIERRGPSRIPMHRMDYFSQATRDKYRPLISRLREVYPDDVIRGDYVQPDWQSLGPMPSGGNRALDSQVIIKNYANINKIAEQIRAFGRDLDLSNAACKRQAHPDRYCLGYSWFGLFERLWMLRGMENALADFYEHPDEIRILMRAICDFHIQAIRRYGDMGYDGVSLSDDLGTQTSTMFSPAIFLKFYQPLYREMFGIAHDYGMHTWMHSCGCVRPFLGDFINSGLDVLHPIQHSTFPGGISANNAKEIVRQFGGKITFWAGIDVQYLMPGGTTRQVREGVRELIDTFDGHDGGLIIAAGNGIPPETPFRNIKAFFNEAYDYGKKKRKADKGARRAHSLLELQVT